MSVFSKLNISKVAYISDTMTYMKAHSVLELPLYSECTNFLITLLCFGILCNVARSIKALRKKRKLGV